MSDIAKLIKQARPKLKTVTPLAYWITLIYAYFNIVFGLVLYFVLNDSKFASSLLIVNNIFTYDIWGVIFVSVGLVKLFALHTNNWKLSRRSLLLGVAIKATWSFSFIVRIFTTPGAVLPAILWVTLATIQVITFIFFMPPAVASFKQPELIKDTKK